MKIKVLIIGLTLLSVLTAKAQLIEHQILPSATDTNINGNNPPHCVYLDNSVNQINKLLLFIPGTNATPWDYRMFQQTAANLGYHSIGLTYENLQSINIQICPATQDPTCHGRARREVWFGEDTHDSISVNYDNSIINRFLKLLKYLDTNYPTENWGQYLINDTTVNWQSVVIAGHSQGAGQATYGSKFFPMNRVIMLSWVDWMWPGTNPLWITQSGQTPDSAYFGFIHTGDASIYNGIPTTWTNLGMNPYGAITNIDNVSPPYSNSHSLVTSAPINQAPTQTNHHNATCVDWVTTITQNGDTLYKPVWKYLLGFVDPVSGVSDNCLSEHYFQVFPNPVQNVLNIKNEDLTDAYTIQIFSLDGRMVHREKYKGIIDVSFLKNGVYIIDLLVKNERIKSKFVKQ
jgi:hypothetical protein